MKQLTAILLAGMLFLFCGNDNPTGTGTLHGSTARILEPGGKKPASGVIVKIFVANAIDTTPVAVCTTDNHGRYALGELPAGEYNVWAEKNSSVLFQGPVQIVSLTESTLRNDTLESASSLTGRIDIHPCHDPRTVSVTVTGSDKKVTIDNSEGKFTLSELAGGTYTLLFSTTLTEYTPTYDTVIVASSSQNTAADPINLTYNGFPMVSDLRISQDTLHGIVTLSWNRIKNLSFQDYVVYRDYCKDFNFSTEIIHATTDTFFIDSQYSPPPSSKHCLEYRVAMRTDLQEIGPMCRSARIVYYTKEYRITYFKDSVRYLGLDTTCATINDKVRLIVTASNPVRSLVSLAWCDPFKGDTIPTIDAAGLNKHTLSDTIELSFDTIGTNRAIVIVTDNAGVVWYDTIRVRIIQDPPKLFAGKDTGVLAGSTVRLRGSAKDSLGSIAGWEWKIGSGSWKKTPGPDIECLAPLTEGVTICSCAVTDDDWNRVTDELLLITSSTAQSVAAGLYHSLILLTDGRVLSCGNNNFGQLGNGSAHNSELPVTIISDIKSIAAGSTYSLFVQNNGTLWTCGSNDSGQLGDGATIRQYSPLPLTDSVQRVTAGLFHTLILKTDGTLWGCGWNRSGQLGDGTRENRKTPVMIMTGVKGMAAGLYHSLILKTDGTVWACGENGGGQLGDGTTGDKITPVQVMSDVTDIVAGGWHSLFLKNDGTLWGCGNNGYGQLGDGTTERRATPVRVMADIKSMATGMYHSLILKSDGVLLACGQCGLIPLELSDEGLALGDPFPLMTGVQCMAAGWYHSLILKSEGSVWACGSNNDAQLGDGTLDDRLRPVCIHPPQSSTKRDADE